MLQKPSLPVRAAVALAVAALSFLALRTSHRAAAADAPILLDHSPTCASCSGHKHRVDELTGPGFDVALDEWMRTPIGAPSPALERLLYHGETTQRMLVERDIRGLAAERRAFLERELRRDAVDVGLRVVDREGVVRAHASGRVRLGVKAHLVASSGEFPEFAEFSGSVLRVGLEHLWSRY